MHLVDTFRCSIKNAQKKMKQFCGVKLFLYIVFLKNLNRFCLTSAATDNSDVFGHCLLELRLPELLRLKHSLDKISDRQTIYENKYKLPNDTKEHCDDGAGPTAMALVGEAREHSSGYEHHQSWLPEEKPSKLQTLFQISITALAFLSFGGYLLCLIVQAIKSKGTTYFYPVTTTATATLNGGLKRIKIYRRSRR